MDTPSTPHASSVIDDLYTLALVDGIPAESGGKPIKFRVVKLRETTVADERAAVRMTERVVMVGGVPKLLVSQSDFQYALTMRHCEKFLCDTSELPQAAIDLEVFGKLSAHDHALIEQRIMLIMLAAELRYGNVSQAEFDAVMSGDDTKGAKGAQAPQRVGQAAVMGQVAAPAGPGPALLADFTGDAAAGASSGDGH